jgi:hypothetical protein
MPYPIKKGKYRHYKGQYYELIDIATHSETLEKMVIYRALYNDFSLWVRPFDMFFECIEFNGQEQPRFEFISELV